MPIAIGMLGDIDDGEAILYAARLYATIANGQSIDSAHAAGRAAVMLAGGDPDIPYLAVAEDVDASTVQLVKPSSDQ